MTSFVARQPILDVAGGIYGYELLFRRSEDNRFDGTEADRASATVIDDTLTVFGLDALAPPPCRAFVNFGRGALLKEAWRVMPHDRVIIELLENVSADDEVLAACRQLREDGYALALDDFNARPDTLPLVAMADIVKVDFLAVTGADRERIAAWLRGKAVRMLAEKVETKEELADAKRLGFSLFQGYHFCKPELLRRGDLAPQKLSYLRLVDEINRPTTSLERMEAILQRDVALAVKLLRYLNTPGFGLRARVTSLRQALMLLGERPFKRWATVLAMRMVGDGKPKELMIVSLLRARFCESLAAASGLQAREVELFLVGLLSTIDALLDRPMEDVLRELPLSPEVTEALLGTPSALGSIYALVRAWERGDWDAVNAAVGELGMSDAAVGEAYRSAVDWVSQTTRLAEAA